MKRSIALISAAVLVTISLSFKLQQDDSWKVPEKYEKLKNPVPMDEASVQSGKEIYTSYCTSCHGLDGKGTGKRAKNLTVHPADFTSAAFQSQTDGALLYKVYFGHEQMPGFRKRLPGKESINENNFGKTRVAGDLVNFLRSFAKK